MSEKLYLRNQLCFPFYAISRNIIKRYTPLLSEINLTYPQYLVMLVLWEKDYRCVKDICRELWLETNTISPLLKILEKKWFIYRKKCESNNKEIYITLSAKGKKLHDEAKNIPDTLLKWLDISTDSLKNIYKELISLMKVLDCEKDTNKTHK